MAHVTPARLAAFLRPWFEVEAAVTRPWHRRASSGFYCPEHLVRPAHPGRAHGVAAGLRGDRGGEEKDAAVQAVTRHDHSYRGRI